MRISISVTAALLAGVAFLEPAYADPKPKADKSCLAVVVGSPQQKSGGGNEDEREFESNATSFSATHVLDIEFAIIFSRTVAAQFSNVHTVEFRVYTPQGNLYESLSIPMTNNPLHAGEKHRVAGYPDLVPVQVLKSINHGNGQGMFAKVTLPVAGTPIVNTSLYGRWSAVALVEDEFAPCATPAYFTLTP